MTFERLHAVEQVEDLLRWHNKNSDFVVVDCETTSVEPREAKLIDVQVSGRHPDSAVVFKADYADRLLVLEKKVLLVAHNYKYDAHVLSLHGVSLLDRSWRDTLLLGHLLDENRESYSLDSYVNEYWNDGYKEAFWSKYKSYEEAPEADRIVYGCTDVVRTSQLYRILIRRLQEEKIPPNLIEHVHRLQRSLLLTEMEGIKVDIDYLQDLGVKIKHRIDTLKPEMRRVVEDELKCIELGAWARKIENYKTDKGKYGVSRPIFSFESSQQLQLLLYGYLGLPKQFNSKTKALSTDFDSLEKIKDLHPVVGMIQENRELQKVYTAYIQGTLDRIENVPGVNSPRVYPSFRVAGTVTGRLAHSRPNLAQLPKQGGVRGVYVPDRGRRLISADYSQLEVVLEANLSGDKNIIRMLENGESKHDLTARELGCDRSTAKTLNFALQYWCTAGKVAKLLGVSSDEGKRIYDKYWEVYSGAKRLKAKTDKMVDDGIPLTTVFGRKRRFQKRSRNIYDGDYRQAYNFLIQGTGADITSKAFYEVSEELESTKTGRGLFTVHDEILIEVDESKVEYWNNRLKEIMESQTDCARLTIPLKVSSSGGMERWED